jgi:superfamily II DNA or RNA helicase
MLKFVETPTRIRVVGKSDHVRALIKEFQYRPPDYWRATSYQIFRDTNGERGWNGYLEPLKKLSDFDVSGGNTVAEIRRGYLTDLKSKAADLGLDFDGSQLFSTPFQGLTPDDIPDDIIVAPFELYEKQRQAIADWLLSVVGMNFASVGAGKTAMFAAAAAMVKRRYPNARFLYFTHTERLCSQVIQEVTKFLPDWDITQFGGGKNNPDGKDMVVATGAMLNRHFKHLKATKWLNTFMCLLIDECHHSASPTWEKCILASSAFFRFGASDSLCEDNLVKWHTIRGLVGPRLTQIESAPLIESGQLAKPHIYLVDRREEWHKKFAGVTHAPEEDSEALVLMDGKWQKGMYAGPVYEADSEAEDGIKRDKKGEPVKLDNFHKIILDKVEHEIESRWCLLDRTRDRAIIRFNERNRLIVEWTKYYADTRNFRTLVVCTPTLHLLILKSLISTAIGKDRVKILYSDHSSAERDEVFDWFRKTKGGVLISSLVKEGVSIPEIEGGVVADYIRSWELARQVIGRFIRKKKDGENHAHVTMFIERQHPKLLKASLEMFDKLSKTKGFTFYHPLGGPDTIQQATRFDETT